jgi:hypothetical protein
VPLRACGRRDRCQAQLRDCERGGKSRCLGGVAMVAFCLSIAAPARLPRSQGRG